MEAEEFFTPDEKAEYERLKSAHRKKEWYGTRIGLKNLLLLCRLITEPLQSCIEKDERGSPRVKITKDADEYYLPCSISHKHDFAAVCVGRFRDIRLGIDLEAVSLKPWKVRSAFYNEMDSLQGTEGAAEYYSTLWACKEAVSKSLGMGMSINYKDLRIVGDRENRFTAEINEMGKSEGFYRFLNGFVMALSLTKDDTKIPE